MTTGARKKLPRNVVALGAVSFFTDAATEMIYPLMPVFLSGVLGANARFIGTIEGLAESVAALLKLASGWWSDRVRNRKPLIVLGYALSTITRPFVGLARVPWHVLAIRVTDRVGKGIRTSPRDALLADSIGEGSRGRAFGFQRAADNAGAVVGPLIAYGVLWWLGAGSLLSSSTVPAEGAAALRKVFLLSAIPGALALLVLGLTVRETRRSEPTPASATVVGGKFGGTFWGYLGVLALFTLGNSSDAFLLLRARDVGVAVAFLPLLWAFFHVVKSFGGTWGGALSDKLGRRPVIVAGWVVYAVAYVGFAFASREWHIWALFAWYGLFHILTEGSERALIADLVSAGRRGAAYGWFNLTVAAAALPASLIFGALWDAYGAPTAFAVGAGLAMTAAVGLLLLPRGPQQRS